MVSTPVTGPQTGGGEHLAHRARENRNIGFIGCEPFVNGMAKLLAAIESDPLIMGEICLVLKEVTWRLRNLARNIHLRTEKSGKPEDLAQVCELINILERASVAGESDFNRLMNEHRALAAPLSAEQAENAPDNLEAAIRVHIRRVYERHGCNLSQTAVALGVSRNTARKHLADSTRPESA